MPAGRPVVGITMGGITGAGVMAVGVKLGCFVDQRQEIS
jgi:hypothetical protein